MEMKFTKATNKRPELNKRLLWTKKDSKRPVLLCTIVNLSRKIIYL